MDSQNPKNNFPELIYKYLSGNTSDAEVQTLEAWVLADPKNKEEFIALKKAWMLSGMKEEQSTLNVDKLWKETSGQVFKEAKTVTLKTKQNRRTWLGIAATISLLLVAAFWFFQNGNTETPMLVDTTNKVKNFELSDGSEITLNQASSLSYRFSKEEGKRKVDLEGDAFFDVKRDEDRPFVIETQAVEIEVLGTSFYVDARTDEDAVEVIVQSGSVAVRYRTEETILKANEKAIFQKSTKNLKKVQNEDSNFRSIQTNVLRFENTKLDEVVFVLNRHFNKNISIENIALNDCEITVTFEGETLEEALKIMEGMLRGVKINQLGDKITLSGLSCD